MALSRQAAARIKQHIALTALAYGAIAGETYAATPSAAQRLNDKIVLDGNWLLPLINVTPVSEITGDKVNLSLSGLVTSRTDTSTTGERTAKSLAQLDAQPYALKKTESDVALKYATIDSWAKFPDFAARYAAAVAAAIGNDRVRIGFNGTSAATASNIGTNPLLQDVNKGWLQLIREYNAGSQYVIGTGPLPIQLGGATFPNLDTLVYSAVNKLAEQFREDPDLVVMLGRGVVQYSKNKGYMANGNTPTEKGKLNEALVVDTYGGLPAVVPPFFPANALVVTSLKNLSIYWQDTSWRRQQIDNPKKDQYEDFNSRQEGYVVEIEEKAALIENITYA